MSLESVLQIEVTAMFQRIGQDLRALLRVRDTLLGTVLAFSIAHASSMDLRRIGGLHWIGSAEWSSQLPRLKQASTTCVNLTLDAQ
jgi:hypothetical protein